MPHISSHPITKRTRGGSVHARLARAQCLRQPVWRLRSRSIALSTIVLYQSTSSWSETRPSPEVSSSRWSLRMPRRERWKPRSVISPLSSFTETEPEWSLSNLANVVRSRVTVASSRSYSTEPILIRRALAWRTAEEFCDSERLRSLSSVLTGASTLLHFALTTLPPLGFASVATSRLTLGLLLVRRRKPRIRSPCDERRRDCSVDGSELSWLGLRLGASFGGGGGGVGSGGPAGGGCDGSSWIPLSSESSSTAPTRAPSIESSWSPNRESIDSLSGSTLDGPEEWREPETVPGLVAFVAPYEERREVKGWKSSRSISTLVRERRELKCESSGSTLVPSSEEWRDKALLFGSVVPAATFARGLSTGTPARRRESLAQIESGVTRLASVATGTTIAPKTRLKRDPLGETTDPTVGSRACHSDAGTLVDLKSAEVHWVRSSSTGSLESTKARSLEASVDAFCSFFSVACLEWDFRASAMVVGAGETDFPEAEAPSLNWERNVSAADDVAELSEADEAALPDAEVGLNPELELSATVALDAGAAVLCQ
mmetsp:Transcript_46339/g.106943  ORF Transcript_46339/g.106943 Transcript_46339/m.106943 type:complete len:545 (+) Transcript_46339:461-2095(+)